MTRYQQVLTFNVTVTTDTDSGGSAWPDDYAGRVLSHVREFDADGVRVWADWPETSARSELPDVNREKLIELAQWAAAEHAKAELGLPSEWDQGQWLINGVRVPGDGWQCGTACCIAGKTVLDDGWRPDFGELASRGESTGRIVKVDEDGGGNVYAYTEDTAREILALNMEQANALFHGSNDLRMVLDVIRRILHGDSFGDND
jgi:hypothetical protein